MCAITRSPGMKPCTPSPACLTTPAISLPGEKGSSGLNWYLFWMRRTSGKFTPLAFTDTKSCPLPGFGEGTSSTTSASGGPHVLHSTAFMRALSGFRAIIKRGLPRSQGSGYHGLEGGVAMADIVTSREPQYVGFWKRVFASIIDTLILVVVIGLIAVAVYGMQYVRLSSQGKTVMFDLLVQGLLPALAVVVFWRYRGATPGKMLISAKIVDAETFGTPSTGKLIGRYFAYIVSCIFMLGFIWIAFDKRKQGWHDKLAGTVVIHAEND